jgi:RNA polymerase primary sigma factor
MKKVKKVRVIPSGFLEEVVASNNVDVDADLDLADILRAMVGALDKLSAREREIISMRYGLGDGFTYSLLEVGKKFGITHERVRQIEAHALRKLQHPCRSNLIADAVEGACRDVSLSNQWGKGL